MLVVTNTSDVEKIKNRHEQNFEVEENNKQWATYDISMNILTWLRGFQEKRLYLVGVSFLVSKSLLGIERKEKLEKFTILTRKPRGHVNNRTDA